MAQEDSNVIDQPEVMKPRMVSIEISGKKYEVPEGITAVSYTHLTLPTSDLV